MTPGYLSSLPYWLYFSTHSPSCNIIYYLLYALFTAKLLSPIFLTIESPVTRFMPGAQ